MTTPRPPYTGHCLCGAVCYEVNGPLTDLHACHCGQCRRQSGHFVVGTSAQLSDFVLRSDKTLTWYKSSASARRGFCNACGTALFWSNDGDFISINAGSLDQPTGMTLERHIFVEDKADYYEIAADGLPRFRGYDTPA